MKYTYEISVCNPGTYRHQLVRLSSAQLALVVKNSFFYYIFFQIQKAIIMSKNFFILYFSYITLIAFFLACTFNLIKVAAPSNCCRVILQEIVRKFSS